MDREPGEQIFFHGHPSWLSMTATYVKGLVLALILGIAAGIASVVADGRVQIEWVVAAVAAAFGIPFCRAQLRRLQITYSVTSRRLAIETGLLSRDLRQTRLDRIQNVNSRQSLLERALGIGTVDFDTAGDAGFDFAFRGVEDPRRIVRAVDRALHEFASHAPPARSRREPWPLDV